jgi:hypothetical protein
MRKIIATRPFSHGGRTVKAGEVFDANPDVAKQLVDKRLAKYFGTNTFDARQTKVEEPKITKKDTELTDISNPFKAKASATRKSKKADK